MQPIQQYDLQQPAPPDDRVLVSIPETGRMLDLGRSSVYRLMGSGQLESVLIGNRRLVTLRSIHELVERLLRGEAE